MLTSAPWDSQVPPKYQQTPCQTTGKSCNEEADHLRDDAALGLVLGSALVQQGVRSQQALDARRPVRLNHLVLRQQQRQDVLFPGDEHGGLAQDVAFVDAAMRCHPEHEPHHAPQLLRKVCEGM